MHSTLPPAHDTVHTRRRAWRWWAGGAIVVLALAAGTLAYLLRNESFAKATDRTAMELVRYTERRLIGHPRLQRASRPLLDAVRRTQEREPPPALPTLGKGQQTQALVAPGFDAEGRPLPWRQGGGAAAQASVRVSSVAELKTAIDTAIPGTVIELAPGRYPLDASLQTRRGGTPAQPITLRAARPATVTLVVGAAEGIVVNQPHWVFENLDWLGSCTAHDTCEHAIHVVGRGRGVVILNNRITDFNAHIKVNGEAGEYPDDGLIQFTTMLNTAPRATRNPVNLIDLVGVRGWHILDNRTERSFKIAGDRTSYGFCIKGAGGASRVERNLVVCSPDQLSAPGLRVGISLGCGASGTQFCRDGRCEFEDEGSVLANNVVAHCNDFGIDLHRARASQVLHNTLVNTEGIDLRQGSTRAKVIGNLIEGLLRDRDGSGVAQAQENLVVRNLDSKLAEPQALDLRWLEASDHARTTRELEVDFCGRRRPPLSPPGATFGARCGEGQP